MRNYHRGEVIDQFFQDNFSLPVSDISRDDGKNVYVYLISDEVIFSTVAALKTAVTNDSFMCLRPT